VVVVWFRFASTCQLIDWEDRLWRELCSVDQDIILHCVSLLMWSWIYFSYIFFLHRAQHWLAYIQWHLTEVCLLLLHTLLKQVSTIHCQIPIRVVLIPKYYVRISPQILTTDPHLQQILSRIRCQSTNPHLGLHLIDSHAWQCLSGPALVYRPHLHSASTICSEHRHHPLTVLSAELELMVCVTPRPQIFGVARPHQSVNVNISFASAHLIINNVLHLMAE